MVVITLTQGSPKFSEIVNDVAQPVLATAINEDGLTTVNQMIQVLSNLLRKTSFLLLSDSSISWNGTNIGNSGGNILLKINQNPAGGVVTITMPTSLLSTYTFSASGMILYFVATQDEITSSFTAGSSNLILVSEGSMPAALTTQSGSANDNTLVIPILARYDIDTNQSAYWPVHGIYWPQNTTSPIGAVITASSSVPIKGVIDYFGLAQADPLGYATLKLSAPGYALCNGAIITDPLSAFANPTRNPDGTPGPSFNPALDVFTPCMNGYGPYWNIANNYNEGDYVYDGSTQEYVAIQAVSSSDSIALTNTAYWIPASTFNNTSSMNPYNAYRKTTYNLGINTFGIGATTTGDANSAGVYGGENNNYHTHSLSAHQHYFGHQHTIPFGIGQETGGGRMWINAVAVGGTPIGYIGGYAQAMATGAGGTAIINPDAQTVRESIQSPDGIQTITTEPSPSSTNLPNIDSTGSPTDTSNIPAYCSMIKIIRIY
jgi:hypothetical protein